MKLQLSKYYCRFNDNPLIEKEIQYINMYVRLQNTCNANCDFCSYRGKYIPFDEDKFKSLLVNIHKKIKINKLSFTGGEPTLDFELFKRMLQFVNDLDEDIFTVVNTNGLHLNKLQELNLNSVALSRHHYNDEINQNIFKCSVPTTEDIYNYKNNNLHISCNLIKNYIDSPQEILNYLKWCDKTNITDVGFVGLMPTNEYCKEHFIDYDVLNLNVKRLIKTRCYSKCDNEKTTCKCSNFLYGGEKNFIKIYCRHYVHNNKESVLVYDCNKLTNGFSGENVERMF